MKMFKIESSFINSGNEYPNELVGIYNEEEKNLFVKKLIDSGYKHWDDYYSLSYRIWGESCTKYYSITPFDAVPFEDLLAGIHSKEELEKDDWSDEEDDDW